MGRLTATVPTNRGTYRPEQLRRRAENLTPRQREVAGMLCSTGLSYKELADKLDMSFGTVRKHVENIYRRIGVHSRAELTVALRNLEPERSMQFDNPVSRSARTSDVVRRRNHESCCHCAPCNARLAPRTVRRRRIAARLALRW